MQNSHDLWHMTWGSRLAVSRARELPLVSSGQSGAAWQRHEMVGQVAGWRVPSPHPPTPRSQPSPPAERDGIKVPAMPRAPPDAK